MSPWNTEFILKLLFFNYCIIFHTNNCKSTFALHCMLRLSFYEEGEFFLYSLFLLEGV